MKSGGLSADFRDKAFSTPSDFHFTGRVKNKAYYRFGAE